MKLHHKVAVFLPLFFVFSVSFVAFLSFTSKAVAETMPPIARAAADSNVELIKQLLDQGAEARVQLPNGHTPLSLAINANCRTCIVQLVSIDSVLNKTASSALPNTDIASKLKGATDKTLRFAVDMRVFSSLSAQQRRALETELNRLRSGASVKITEGNYNIFFGRKNAYLDELSKKDVTYIKMQNKQFQKEVKRQHAANKKRSERDKRKTEQKQKQADRVVDALIEQNPELKDVLQQVADGKDLCRYSSQISTGIKRFSCEYMTDGQIREYGRSESCQSAKQALSKTATSNTLTICDATKAAEARLLDSLADPYQKTAMRQRISQSGSNQWNLASVEKHFAYPVGELERLREHAKRAQEQQLSENKQRAWANFSHALEASSSAYQNSPATIHFKQFHQRAEQVIIDHQMLQAAQRQANSGSQTQNATTRADEQPGRKPPSEQESIEASAQRCELQGGRFDAARNNCTIVSNRTTAIVQGIGSNPVMASSQPGPAASSNLSGQGQVEGEASIHFRNSGKNTDGASGSGTISNNIASTSSASDKPENGWVWKTRLDCASTHFDDVMPEKAVVCMNAAIPGWQIVWRNKPLLGGIHIAVFSIENQSDVSLTFDMIGRARGDMETKDFEWKVSVPAHSTRTYHGGIVQMEEPIHNIELRNLRIREPVL